MQMVQWKSKKDWENSGPHLWETGGLVLLCVLESMKGDAGPAGSGVALSVEQCPHPEPLLPALIANPLHMLWKEEGGKREDGLGYVLWKHNGESRQLAITIDVELM